MTSRRSPLISTSAALGFQGAIAAVGALAVWLLGTTDLVGPSGWLAAVGFGVAGSVATFLLLSALARTASPWHHTLSKHMRQLEHFAHDYSWPVLLLLCLLAGIGEEMLFRGALQTWLGRYLGDGLAIAGAAIAFGLVHYLSFAYFLIATGLGFVLGLAYWFTDSLLLVMVWHGVYDMIALYSLRHHPHRFGIH